LREWNIPEEAQMYWDLEDEQVCKSQELTMLKKKHGETSVQTTLDRFMSLGDSLRSRSKTIFMKNNFH
jgi:hypothetical protein